MNNLAQSLPYSKDIKNANKGDNKPLVIPLPTKLNYKIYDMYVDGLSQTEIAKRLSVSVPSINNHIKRVNDYHDLTWRNNQVVKYQREWNNVLDGFKELVSKKKTNVDSATVNNWCNKFVFPNKSEVEHKGNINVNHIAAGLGITDNDEPIEAECQVIDDNADTDTPDNTPAPCGEALVRSNNDEIAENSNNEQNSSINEDVAINEQISPKQLTSNTDTPMLEPCLTPVCAPIETKPKRKYTRRTKQPLKPGLRMKVSAEHRARIKADKLATKLRANTPRGDVQQ